MWPTGPRRLQTIQFCRFLTTQPQRHQLSPFILRPYQEICLKACLDAHSSGVSRVGVSLPTGAGKTAVFISLLSSLEPRNDRPDATRSLVIVNSIELAKQAAAQAKRLRPDWVVEIEQGKHKASGDADL
jgi:ATP-dependent helicase IRC3